MRNTIDLIKLFSHDNDDDDDDDNHHNYDERRLRNAGDNNPRSKRSCSNALLPVSFTRYCKKAREFPLAHPDFQA